MVNVDHLVRKVKLKVEVIVYDLVLKKVMHIVLDQLRLKNVKIHLAPTHYQGKNGNVKVVDQ
jgi:hypothetical protein